jgi:hypothetical protein
MQPFSFVGADLARLLQKLLYFPVILKSLKLRRSIGPMNIWADGISRGITNR